MRAWIAPIAAAGVFLAGASAHAAGYNWTLSGLTFANGDYTASGTFTLDGMNMVTAFDLTVGGLTMIEFSNTNGARLAGQGSDNLDFTNTAGDELQFAGLGDLDGMTNPDAIRTAFIYHDSGSFAYFDSNGQLSAVAIPDTTPAPEPVSLTIFAAGLIGLAANRRRVAARAI